LLQRIQIANPACGIGLLPVTLVKNLFTVVAYSLLIKLSVSIYYVCVSCRVWLLCSYQVPESDHPYMC